LQAEELSGAKHRKFRIRDDAGRLVASTAMSRSWRRTKTLDSAMVATIRRELGLQEGPQVFRGLIDCPATRNDYIRFIAEAAS
jgi:hypothetical protein